MNSASVYLATQVVASTPVERVALLYRGAIRFGTLHVEALGRGDRQAAHTASVRAQEIVSALRGSLDMAAGPVAVQLDTLYDFCLGRLVDGNVRKDPAPTREALVVLSGLLEAWAELASHERADTSAGPAGGALTPAAGAVAPGRGAAAAAYGIVR